MQHHTHTSLFTTVSGVVGGVGKAISAKPLLLAITLPGLTTVIIYASASAVAGYVVKKLLNACSHKLNQFLTKNLLTTMNKFVGITLGAVAVYGIVRLLKMQNVGDQINISLVNPRVHAVNLGGLSFRKEVAINNPSKDSVKITKPVVSVKSKGKLLSQSNAENKEITIKPLGVTQIDTIELQINWMTLIGLISTIVSKVPAVITAFKSGNKKNLIDQIEIPIEMSFSTYVNGLFYESEPSKII